MNEDQALPQTKGNNTFKIFGVAVFILISLLALISYFPDINLPWGYTFRFIEPVRREYAKTYLFFFGWLFIQAALIGLYAWIVKSIFGLLPKIKSSVEKVVRQFERISQ